MELSMAAVLTTTVCFRMRKLIDMGDGDVKAKKIHYDNLWQIVRYCENINDCRYVFCRAVVFDF